MKSCQSIQSAVSRTNPTNQTHAVVALGAFLNEIWLNQKIHGFNDEVMEFLKGNRFKQDTLFE